MNLETQMMIFQNFVERQRKIFEKKGDDYANEDRLSNFKLAGSITQISPMQQCLSLIATKVARLGVLLSNDDKTAKNEPIDDSIIDLAIYSFLLHCINEENKGERVPVPYIYNNTGGIGYPVTGSVVNLQQHGVNSTDRDLELPF